MLATMVRDVPIDLDLEAEFTRTPDRTNLRTVFRDWELRDPLRRLEEALEAAELEAIPRPEDVDTIQVKTGAARSPYDIARLKGEYLTLAIAPAGDPRGRADPARAEVALRRLRGRRHRARGGDRRPGAGGPGRRRPRGHRPRRQGAHRRPAEPRLRHRRRRLPARPGPPRLPARRARRGARDRRRRGRRARHHRGPDPRAREPPAPADRRARPPADLLDEIELPLVHVLRETEKAGIKLDTNSSRPSPPGSAPTSSRSSARSGSSPARSS